MKRRMTVDDLDQSVARKLDEQTASLQEFITSSISESTASESSNDVSQQISDMCEDVSALRHSVSQIAFEVSNLKQLQQETMAADKPSISNEVAKEATRQETRIDEIAEKIDSVAKSVSQIDDAIGDLHAYIGTALATTSDDATGDVIRQQHEAMQEYLATSQQKMDDFFAMLDEKGKETLDSLSAKADEIVKNTESTLLQASSSAEAQMGNITNSYQESASKIEKKIDENTLDQFWTGGMVAGILFVIVCAITIGVQYGMQSYFDVGDDVKKIEETTNKIIWNQYYPAIAPGTRMYSPFEPGFDTIWNNQDQVEKNARQAAEQQKNQQQGK